MRGDEGGLLRGPGLAVGLVDEGGVEVDHADTAVGGEGAELRVGEVAQGGGEGAGGGVRDEDGGAGDGENSSKVRSETWKRSTIMPRRFISAMTWRPKGVRPAGREGLEGVGRESPEDSAQSLELVQVRVM